MGKNDEQENGLTQTIKKNTGPPFVIIFGFILSICALALFGKLADEVWDNETITFDHAIIDWLHSFSSLWLNAFMLMMTRIGSVIWVSFFSLLIILWLYFKKKDKVSIVFLLGVVCGGGLLNYVLKQFFHRARPLIDPAIGAVGFSFPSGHAMGSMVFYGFCGYLVIHSGIADKKVKVIVSIILSLFILLIGISRIYLNAHYPSDVIAGYAAGLIWILFCISALKSYKTRKAYSNNKNFQEQK